MTTPSPVEAAQPAKAPTHPHDYDSNPFTTALAGLKRLRNNGGSNIVGVFVIEVLLGILGILAVFIAGISGLLIGLKVLMGLSGSADRLQNAFSFLPPEVISAVNNVDVGMLIVTGVIAAIAAGLLFLFIQALQLAGVGTAVADDKKVDFKAVFALAMRRMWGVAGYGILWFLVGIVWTAIPLLIGLGLDAFSPNSSRLGIWVLFSVVYAIPSIVLFIYTGLRLSFTEFGIVLEGKKISDAIRSSWAISKGRVIEIMGVGAAVTSATYVVTIVADLLSRVAGPSAMALGMIATVIVGLLGMAGIAERFRQIRTAQANGLTAHKTNIGLNLAAVGLAIILGSIANMSGQPGQTLPNTPENPQQKITRPADGNYDGRTY